MGKTRIDLIFFFDRYLIGEDDNVVDPFFELLRRLAPMWSRQIRLLPSGPNSDERIDLPADVAFVSPYVLSAITTVGPTYGRIADQLIAAGVPVPRRIRGSTEVRGTNSTLIGVIRADAEPLVRFGGRLLPNNEIALQFDGARFERRPIVDWANEAFEMFCRELRPAWAAVYESSEWDSKVMRLDAGARAVGVDFARFLPGLFAANYFGPRYVELMGRQRLMDMRSTEVAEVGDGILVRVVDDPTTWRDPAIGARYRRLIDSLGEDLFFSIEEPNRPSRAPEWDAEITP